MATFTKKYNPDRNKDWNFGGAKWRLSRSKIDLFIECPRCFYIDNKLGTARPRGPAFTLNIAVDTLFKREFDSYRTVGKPHPIMIQNGIHAVPFAHTSLDTWRENFEGIEYTHEPTGLTVSGAVDDIWIDSEGKLIVVDYKSTAKEGTVETLSDSAWEEQYKRQIGVYQWLLRNNGFEVSDIGYFVYANGDDSVPTFNNTLQFETTIIPCKGDTLWIESVLGKIKECLLCETYPTRNDTCEYCAYREACGKKLQKIHIKA